MRKIVFFNTYHIGDVYWMRGFVKNIVENNTDVEFSYWVPQGHAFFKDININFASQFNFSTFIPNNLRIITQQDEYTFVNTWVKSFWEDPGYNNHPVQECNIYDKYEIFKKICNNLNLNFTLKVEDIIPRLPDTDISYFLKWHEQTQQYQKIFYFNYLGKSGQATSISTMPEHDFVINSLSQTYKNSFIIVPGETNCNNTNVINCEKHFNIHLNPTCENVIQLHKIANYCNFVFYSSVGACFVLTNRDTLEASNKKVLLVAGGSVQYGNAINNACMQIHQKAPVTIIDAYGSSSVLNSIQTIIPL